MTDFSVRKIALYVLLPAIIAGLFSVLPKLYDIYSERNAKLSYSIIEGPGLSTGKQYHKIISINIINDGNQPLSDIRAILEVTNGTLDIFAVDKQVELAPKMNRKGNLLTCTIDALHPKEYINISAMITASDTNYTPNFILKSREVIGTAKVQEVNTLRKELKWLGLGGISSAISVMLISTVFLFGIRRKLGLNDKQDILFYIAARLQLYAICREIHASGPAITYLRTADMLLGYGLTSTKEEREKAIRGLKSMLLIKRIADPSLEVIQANLKVLEGALYSETEKDRLRSNAIDVDRSLELRNAIEKHVIMSVSGPGMTC